MIYLVLTILLNALLAVLFKLFARFDIEHLQAIVFNYFVCIITGVFFMGYNPIGIQSIAAPWFQWAVLMGLGFITVFNLFAFNTKTAGITAATVANKLSLVIPVAFSMFLYKEQLSWIHFLGIMLAFPAVYFASKNINSETEVHTNKYYLIWTAILFIGSGLLDTAMKFVQHNYLPNATLQASFTIHVFAVAGSIGAILLFVLLLLGKTRFAWRNVLGGIVLGVPNYFSIYFMIRMLNSNFLKSSAMIPLSNIGVLFASTLSAIVFFKEKMNQQRWLGLLLSLLVIFLLAFS